MWNHVGQKKSLRDLWKQGSLLVTWILDYLGKSVLIKVTLMTMYLLQPGRLSSMLLFPICCATISPEYVLKPIFHFIIALLGAFFGGRESLKLRSILALMQVCAHLIPLVVVLHFQYRLLFQEKSFSCTALLECLNSGPHHNFIKTR